MSTLMPWRFGAVFAATVFTGYAVCTVIWFAFMDLSLAFLNGLFHGLDFRRLYAGGGFQLDNWMLALAVLSGWAFLIGALFAQLRNWIRVERTSN